MLSVNATLALLVGGAIGAFLRLHCIRLLAGVSSDWPLGMVCVNLLGCFLAGVVYTKCQVSPSDWIRFGLLGGLLGALTTFSTFAIDAMLLWQARQFIPLFVLCSL